MTKFLQPQIRRRDERARQRHSRAHIANALMLFQQTGHIVCVNIFKCLDADPRGSTGPHQSSTAALGPLRADHEAITFGLFRPKLSSPPVSRRSSMYFLSFIWLMMGLTRFIVVCHVGSYWKLRGGGWSSPKQICNSDRPDCTEAR